MDPGFRGGRGKTDGQCVGVERMLLVSGPIRKLGWGGVGGGAVVLLTAVWPNTKTGGGGGIIAYRGARDIVQ